MENNENLNNQVNNNNVLIIIMALIILGLAGYIVYTKFIQKSENSELKPNDTQEKECNCSTSCLGEKITSVKEIKLTTTNQDIKIGEKTYKIKTDDEGILYIDNEKVYVYGNDFAPSNVYLTDKYLFSTVAGQFYESIMYAIDEQGKIGVGSDDYTMENFKVVDGYLHATGGKIVFGGLDLGVDMKDLLIKYIDNNLIITYAK